MEAASLSKVQFANLPRDRGQSIAYTYQELIAPKANKTRGTILIVFVNGLGLPQAFWKPTIDLLQQEVKVHEDEIDNAVSLFTYDRRGQGLSQSTSSSPTALSTPTHDLMSSVQELDDMITFITTNHLSNNRQGGGEEEIPTVTLMTVAHSIGVPLARLHSMTTTQDTQEHHQHKTKRTKPTALLALDSNIANTDFISLMPDPSSSTFNPHHDLPPDTTITQLEWTRSNYAHMFHPSTPNPEGLDRSNLPRLLPHAGLPLLFAPSGEKVLLTVVGHDPDTFAEESLKISTRGLTERYLQPAWERYNSGLLDLGETDEKVVLAEGSGHFVQRDNPGCVAGEIWKLLRRVSNLRS